ncbi:MAG TPA: glycine--tRNA ligase [Candidatus Marinimicrobia bacterium]|nr:glycine--tRNA ligase [Candidatus Neomarinimicrobiota bacterium]
MGKQVSNEQMDKLVSLCKRRGIIFQSSDIYGGLSSTWDYGPLGVELKRNVKDLWWHDMVTSRENVVGMDAAILMHPKVWEASGHVANFHDPLIDCKKCQARFREDKAPAYFKCSNCNFNFYVNDGLIEVKKEFAAHFPDLYAREIAHYRDSDCPHCGGQRTIKLEKIACPNCGGSELSPARQFNLMFKTHFGPSEDSASEVYLRPETAQGIFVNFDNIISTTRVKLPFGVGQIGKAFRNEITTGNFIFRSREFEQMEMEFFVKPEESGRWYEYWVNERFNWYKKLGVRAENLRRRPHEKEELAHYAKACTDVEYKFPFGWSELEGIADRQTFDLEQHMKASGKKLTYFDSETNTHIVPAVVESSAGVDRTILTVLCDAYWEDAEHDRVVLRLDPKIAPTKVAILPLVNRDGMPEIAEAIFNDVKKQFAAFYDQAGSIGRRYRRQDEAGTPFGITVDSQTLQDGSVTLRDRDTLEQIRLPKENIVKVLQEKLAL